jgi:hypothetical protein
MSLTLLLDPDTVATMMTTWPVAPSVHDLPGGSALPQVFSPDILYDYLDTGSSIQNASGGVGGSRSGVTMRNGGRP